MAGRRRHTARRKGAKKPKRPHPKAIAATANDAPTDRGPDWIVCLLCGEEYRAITPAHLRSAHGFRGPHPVLEYKRQFGLRVAVCADTQELVRGARRRQLQRDETRTYWSKPKLRAEVQRRARTGESLAPSSVGDSLYAAARRAFGSWDAMLGAAGLEPQAHRMARSWSRDAVLDAIRLRAAEHATHALAAMREKDQALLGAAVRAFGSWSAAVAAAACQEQGRPASRRKWTWDAARRWVLDRRRQGKPITGPHVPLGLRWRVRTDTGEGWGAFVESLGIEYPLPMKQSRWNAEKVRTLLRGRERAGLSMAEWPTREQAPRLHAEALRRCGSWSGALEAAGLDPALARAGAARKPRARRRGPK